MTAGGTRDTRTCGELQAATALGMRLAHIPGVQEVHDIAGEDCCLSKVRMENTGTLGQWLQEQSGAIETARSTQSTIMLATQKETACLPIPEPASLQEAP